MFNVCSLKHLIEITLNEIYFANAYFFSFKNLKIFEVPIQQENTRYNKVNLHINRFLFQIHNGYLGSATAKTRLSPSSFYHPCISNILKSETSNR